MSYYHFRIVQNGMTVAQTEGADRSRALAEIEHYTVLYSQEGAIRLETRTGKGRWREYLS